MTTSQQNEFIQSNGGDLTPQQAAQLLEMGNGDTSTPALEQGGEPEATPEVVTKVDTPVDEGKNPTNTDPATTDPDPANTVILAKDGKHTIGYEKLVEAREGEKRWKAQAEAAQQQLADLQAEAQRRAEAGQAPTATDNQVAAAEAAIAQGTDPGLFGDFSEEAMAKGIQTLVEQKVAAQVDARVNERVKAALEPLQRKQATEAVEAHYGAIYEKHPDADSIVESKELADWIAEQPSFVRDAYSSVFETGTTGQVIELLDRFKQANGSTQAATTNTEDVKAAAKAAIASAKPPVPTSLSDFPGGRPGAGASHTEVLAAMNAHELSDAMQNMTPEQIEKFLNRRI